MRVEKGKRNDGENTADNPDSLTEHLVEGI